VKASSGSCDHDVAQLRKELRSPTHTSGAENLRAVRVLMRLKLRVLLTSLPFASHASVRFSREHTHFAHRLGIPRGSC
jgi:hypothetical protein